MICKDCRTEMDKDILDGVLIDRCGVCEGIWLDGGELDKIVRSAGQDPAKLALQAREERADERKKVASKSVCPRCSAGPLKRHVLHGVALDRCGACKGLWFDHGELDKVKKGEEKAGSGVLGSLRKLFGP